MREYEHISAAKLSGGNKRRLSLGIAFIGEPPILLLDEASTGMDPLSRRLLWRIITKAARENYNPTVLFTTHSMEEAEVLSDQLSFLTKGELKLKDAPHNIRQQFGIGYEINVNITVPDQVVLEKCGVLHPQSRANERDFRMLRNESIDRRLSAASTNTVSSALTLADSTIISPAEMKLKDKVVRGDATIYQVARFFALAKLARVV